MLDEAGVISDWVNARAGRASLPRASARHGFSHGAGFSAAAFAAVSFIARASAITPRAGMAS